MLSPLKAESMEMNIKQKLAENEWKGEIGFTIESRAPERVVARMPVIQAAKNPFGTMHAGAQIWFVDIAATLCAIGDLDSIGEDGSGFPLAVDQHDNYASARRLPNWIGARGPCGGRAFSCLKVSSGKPSTDQWSLHPCVHL